MVRVENITQYYGTQKAVDNVSFTVNTGEIVGFLGPNGAGKTTTMRIIACATLPNMGNVWVGEWSVRENAHEIKKNIGYLPENNPLYKDMPVLEFLKFIAEIHSIKPNLIQNRLNEMVEMCGLQLEKHKKIGELSKGYQQRVGLAQALIHDPQVLILDEPTSGLDPNQIVEIRELIKRIGKQKTVLLSSHMLGEVEATCNRIIIIHQGKIVADGSPEMLRNQSPGCEILHVKIEDGQDNLVLNALRLLNEVESAEYTSETKLKFVVTSKKGCSAKKAIFNLCVEKHWTLAEISVVEQKLEDVFRLLTD